MLKFSQKISYIYVWHPHRGFAYYGAAERACVGSPRALAAGLRLTAFSSPKVGGRSLQIPVSVTYKKTTAISGGLFAKHPHGDLNPGLQNENLMS